jgi:predicted nucleic acid-binding protein
MVIPDSSVWIQFLSKRLKANDLLKALVEEEQVMSHELVFAELLMGDNGGRRKFLADYFAFPTAATVPYEEVVHFVKARRLHGLGLSWVDANLLASAVVERAKLWTLDAELDQAARRLGVRLAH